MKGNINRKILYTTNKNINEKDHLKETQTHKNTENVQNYIPIDLFTQSQETQESNKRKKKERWSLWVGYSPLGRQNRSTDRQHAQKSGTLIGKYNS